MKTFDKCSAPWVMKNSRGRLDNQSREIRDLARLYSSFMRPLHRQAAVFFFDKPQPN